MSLRNGEALYAVPGRLVRIWRGRLFAAYGHEPGLLELLDAFRGTRMLARPAIRSLGAAVKGAEP